VQGGTEGRGQVGELSAGAEADRVQGAVPVKRRLVPRWHRQPRVVAEP